MRSQRTGVEEVLVRLVKNLDPDDTAASAHRLARLSIRSLIERCLNDDTGTLLSEMSTESYRHANGFDKISLPIIPGSPLRARVHIWRPGAGPQDVSPGDAHNHRWPIASRTIVGSLRNDLYVARHKSDGEYIHYRHFMVDPLYAYGFSRLGRAELSQREELITQPGETYTLSSQTIHQAAPAKGEYTATVALELNMVREVTDVFTLTADKSTDAKVAPPRYHPDTLRGKLSELYRRC